jgi:hypothetical protein
LLGADDEALLVSGDGVGKPPDLIRGVLECLSADLYAR